MFETRLAEHENTRTQVLDFFDGYFARLFNQCSKFGEFLDVLADNVSRTLLWICVLTRLSGAEWIFSIIPIILEWTCFVSSHTLQDTNWEDLAHKDERLDQLEETVIGRNPTECANGEDAKRLKEMEDRLREMELGQRRDREENLALNSSKGITNT